MGSSKDKVKPPLSETLVCPPASLEALLKAVVLRGRGRASLPRAVLCSGCRLGP